MASTIVALTENIIQTPAVVAAVTAAKTDIEALQTGSTVITTAVAAGATEVMTTAQAGSTILLDTLTGSVCTLPASSGSGRKYKFVVSVLATSNSHVIQVANATDVFRGIIFTLDSDLATVNMFGFAAGATADTITLNRTTTGSVTLGEWIEVEDIATGFYYVRGLLSGTAPATPFSAAV